MAVMVLMVCAVHLVLPVGMGVMVQRVLLGQMVVMV
jgi:hypothetical protein